MRAGSNALGGAAALKMGPLLCRFTAWGPLQVKKPGIHRLTCGIVRAVAVL